MCSSLDIKLVKKYLVNACIIYLGVVHSYIQHIRVSLAACVINFHLEHSFYIDIKLEYHFQFQQSEKTFCYSSPNLL